MPLCFSISIQSETAYLLAFRPLTVPASRIAPPKSSSFSVSVVLPASGCEMIANVFLRLTSLEMLSMYSTILVRLSPSVRNPSTALFTLFQQEIFCQKKSPAFFRRGSICLVEHGGFEPPTSTLRTLRATNCANAPSRLIMIQQTLSKCKSFSPNFSCHFAIFPLQFSFGD